MCIVSLIFFFVGFVDFEGLNPVRMIGKAGHFLQNLNLSWLQS